MNLIFEENINRKVTEANINYYATPFIHPERSMAEHDFIYMLEGEWKIGQNDQVFTLEKDSLLILSANNRHYGVSPCAKETKTMYFHLSCSDGDGFTDQNGMLMLTNVSGRKNVKRIFRDIVEAKLAGKDKKAGILAELLICELNDDIETSEQSPLVEQIKSIIHRSPERFFGNKELADRVGVSVKTAENRFKEVCGITIHQYILKFKVEQAVSYFKNFPDMQIKEVAYNLGFYDEYHFSKQFSRIIGCSPSAFKRGLLK